MGIIEFQNNRIDISAIRSNKAVSPAIIAPATEEIETVLAADHTSEPIRSMDDIIRISDYLIQSKRYRDNMLFIVGINFGLRVGDLRMLRFQNLINPDFTFKDSFPVFEQKTRNTRTRKRNRYITINEAVREAVILYLENTPNVCLSDYMFRSQSNRGGNLNEPIRRYSIERMLKGVTKELGIDCKTSTHTLRKTFAFHQMLMSNNDPRKLLLLQKILGHSSAAQTLDYIGLTNDEIADAYLGLNLGSRTKNYLIDSTVYETETAS